MRDGCVNRLATSISSLILMVQEIQPMVKDANDDDALSFTRQDNKYHWQSTLSSRRRSGVFRMVRSPKSSSNRHSSSNQKSKRRRHGSSSASEDEEQRQRYQRRHRSQSPPSTTSERERERLSSNQFASRLEVRVKQEPVTDNESHQRRPQRPRPAQDKSYEWGKQAEQEKAKEEPVEKERPNFGISGALLKDTNTYKGVVIKYSEPIEARKPKRRWRWYVFKGEQVNRLRFTDAFIALFFTHRSCPCTKFIVNQRI